MYKEGYSYLIKMSKISLALYNVRIREKRSNKFLKINNYDGKESSLYTLFCDYLKHIKKLDVNEESEKAIIIQNLDQSDSEKTVKGIIQTGDFGYETEIQNIHDVNRHFTRGVNDAEMRPFYYNFSISERNNAILSLQRFAQFGIAKLIMESFNNFLKENKGDNYSLDFNPIVPEGLIDKYKKEGVIKSVTFKRYLLPSDIADGIFDPNNKETGLMEGVLKVEFTPKRNSDFILKPNATLADLTKTGLTRNVAVLRGMDTAHDISVDMEMNGSKKKINLVNNNKIRSYYDITDKVTTAKNGHPTFESIDKNALEILNEIKTTI